MKERCVYNASDGIVDEDVGILERDIGTLVLLKPRLAGNS